MISSVDTKTLFGLFTKGNNAEIFPYMRRDAFERKSNSGQLIVEYAKDGRPVGLITWMQYTRNSPHQVGIKGDVQLCEIVVDPDYWGLGVAQKLFGRLENMAKMLGADAICLSVRADNLRAQAFYEKVGMQVVGNKSWSEQGHVLPGLIYRKELKR